MRIHPGEFVELAPKTQTDENGKPYFLHPGGHSPASGVFVAVERFDADGPVFYVVPVALGDHYTGQVQHVGSANVYVVRAWGEPDRLAAFVHDLRSFANKEGTSNWVPHVHARAGATADRLERILPTKPIDVGCVDRAIERKGFAGGADYSGLEARVLAHAIGSEYVMPIFRLQPLSFRAPSLRAPAVQELTITGELDLLTSKQVGAVAEDAMEHFRGGPKAKFVYLTLTSYMTSSLSLLRVLRDVTGHDFAAYGGHGLDVRVKMRADQLATFLVRRNAAGCTNDWKGLKAEFAEKDPHRNAIGNWPHRRGLPKLVDVSAFGADHAQQ